MNLLTGASLLALAKSIYYFKYTSSWYLNILSTTSSSSLLKSRVVIDIFTVFAVSEINDKKHYCKFSIKPPRDLFISSPFEEGLNGDGGLI